MIFVQLKVSIRKSKECKYVTVSAPELKDIEGVYNSESDDGYVLSEIISSLFMSKDDNIDVERWCIDKVVNSISPESPYIPWYLFGTSK